MRTSQELWKPGRDLAIDEAMCPFEGRSFDTLIIPGKPIDEGYKVWVEAQRGYFFAWVFHRKGSIKDNKKRGPLGPWNIKQPKELGDNNSSAVVAHLVTQLPEEGKGHVLYLDNLFTNVKLLTYLRRRGIGVTGTCTGKSGILKDFSDKKKEDAKKDQIPWGTLYAEASVNGDIQYVAWKDNALVLFMTTVGGELDFVERERKRPSETSTSAKTSRKPFGDNATKVLGIPVLDDKYNHQMGAVDQGNQLKAGYTLQGIHRRGGHHSLVTWLLETALVNSYLLSYYSPVEEKERFTEHKAFREAVIAQCFDLGRSRPKKRKSPTYTPDKPSFEVPVEEHKLVHRSKITECAICKRGVKRVAFSELSGNKRGCEKRKRTSYGCGECNTPLCKEGLCFRRFHGLQ